MADINFQIEFKGFNEGLSPLAHLDTKTFVGNKGQASEIKADVISKPGLLTQSPALANLTNGTQAGIVDQLIRFILDQPVASDTTYAIGTTKLFKLSSTAVVSGGTPSWPQAITNMTEGESVIRLKANVFAFYNKSSGGDIAAMPISTEVIDPDWGSATDAALEKALHPCAAKEDIMVFGNGRYLGVYIEGLAVLDVHKLDFGEGAEVADVVFSAGFWYIAVNHGEGKGSRIYLYDASAISNILSDEVVLGDQEIGFLYVKDGVVYVCYKDLTSAGLIVGWISGRQVKPLRYFTGALPDHRQKALYKNTIIFVSSSDIWSIGASVEQLPIQISKLADGGYATLGGIASPFGTPMIASTDSATPTPNCRLAKFSGYTTDSLWKSVFVDITSGNLLGKVTKLIVYTKALEADAKCKITIEGNQGDKTSNILTVTGTGKRRFAFRTITLPSTEDIRIIVDYTNGNATNDCPIRKMIALGNYVESE